jgi:cytochrome c551/c552
MKYLLALLITSTTAWANDGEALAKQRACLGCHSTQHIGISYPPALVRVADKYKDNPEQIKYSIRNGKGKMPAHPTLTDAEILILTNWILSLGENK